MRISVDLKLANGMNTAGLMALGRNGLGILRNNNDKLSYIYKMCSKYRV